MTAHFHEPLFAMLHALTPPEKILPSEWIERELILPRESTARAGRVALFTLQKGMVNAAAEPGVREIVFMTSAQLGKTLALNGVLGWAMATDGGPLMIVRPDEADASSYVRENLDPLIAATPALRKIIGDGAGFDNKGFKSFRGGSLALASSYKASALAGRSIRVLLADEIDRFAPVVSTGEGEPVTLAKRRLHTYRNSLCILSSTPTFAATSRIAKHYERGDKRLFHVTCQECGALAPVSQDRLRFEKGEPSTARLICLDCGHSADEAERLDMVRKGEWIATATGENGVVSFHASELASELSSLEKIAAQVDAGNSLEDQKAVQNLVWGLPFENNVEIENNASDLQARAVQIDPPFDPRIDFITCGVDVQSNRIEVGFLAHIIASNERFLLDRLVLNGDSSADPVWRDLHQVLGQTFALKNGKLLPLSATFIDASFNTQRVAEFVSIQRRSQRRVWAIFGRPGWDRPTAKEGSKVKGLLRGLILGVDNLKLALMKSLALREPGPNYIHLPAHLDSEAFDQLTSEKLEVRYVRGFPKHTWVKDPNVRNELLDILVYASAAASLVSKPAKPLNSKQQEPSIADIAANLNSHNAQTGASQNGRLN